VRTHVSRDEITRRCAILCCAINGGFLQSVGSDNEHALFAQRVVARDCCVLPAWRRVEVRFTRRVLGVHGAGDARPHARARAAIEPRRRAVGGQTEHLVVHNTYRVEKELGCSDCHVCRHGAVHVLG
jgi:hypothetical protein